MKQIIAACLISLSGVSASAGNISYVSPQSVNIEVEPNFGLGSGGWVVPAILLAVVTLIVTSSSSCVECGQ